MSTPPVRENAAQLRRCETRPSCQQLRPANDGLDRMPAVAAYVRRPGTTVFRAQSIDVLRVRDGRIAEITTFEPHLLPAFGLPLVVR